MSSKIKLKCPECEEKFLHDMTQGWPEICPICDAHVGMGDKPEIALPAFLSPTTKATDGLYRAMEEGAEHRVTMAAEQLGVPRSELADMRITNMRDNMKVGEIAAVPPPPSPVSMAMDQNPSVYGFRHDGAVVSQGTMDGPNPNAGAHFQQVLRRHHVANADPRQAHLVSSERPALETQQPGYRSRV